MAISGKTIQNVLEMSAESLSSYGKTVNKAGVAGAYALGLHGKNGRIAATAITGGIVGGMAGQALGTTMNIDDGFGEMLGGSLAGAGLGAVGGAGIGAVAAAIAKGRR